MRDKQKFVQRPCNLVLVIAGAIEGDNRLRQCLIINFRPTAPPWSGDFPAADLRKLHDIFAEA